MNITLTLCDKNFEGEIPVRHFEGIANEQPFMNDAQDFLDDWLASKNLNESVLVCFEVFRNLPNLELRSEQNSILVSHDWASISTFCENILDGSTSSDVDFCVFEFDSYQDAFGYCADLKESF